MNKELSKVLRQIIIQNGGLNFVEKMFGVVQTGIKQMENENGISIIKRFPIATDQIVENCFQKKEEITIPNSNLKGILYFEDNGTSTLRERRNFTYISKLRLICWINKNKVTADAYSEITGIAINDIIQKLKVGEIIRSASMFNNIRIEVSSIPAQNANLFSKYTYDETQSQYLRPPFEFFGIDLNVKYNVNPKCIEEIQIIENVCS